MTPMTARTRDVSSREKFVSIQVLRALAAVMVVVFHMPGALGAPDLDLVPLASGVDLFFVVSGFVMVLSAGRAKPSAREFIAQRFVRIVPLYWLMTVVALAVGFYSGEANHLGMLVKSLLFIPYQDVSTGFMQPILGVGWTLNLEIVFYLLFALTMVLGSVRQMIALAALFGGAVAVRIVVAPPTDHVLFFYTTPMIFEFLAGMLVGHSLAAIRRMPAWMALVAVIFAVALSLVLTLELNLPRTLGRGVPAVLLVMGCIRLEQWFRTERLRGVAYLGDASYSLYLTHLTVLVVMTPWATTAPLPVILTASVLLATCLGTGLLTYRFVEKPLLKMFRPKRVPALAGA